MSSKITAQQREQQMLEWLVEWGGAHADVRAMILTSTRANPDHRTDALSDYDVIIAVRDVRPWLEDRSWLNDYAPVLVYYADPPSDWFGHPSTGFITQYDDMKIDYSIVQVDSLREFVRLTLESGELNPDWQIGYCVLLDRDDLLAGMPAPDFRAYIPTPPDEREYLRVVQEFFHEGTYAVKNWWRREWIPFQYFLQKAMFRDNLLPMLTWRMEIDHAWDARVGVLGRGLHRQLPQELLDEVMQVTCACGWEGGWETLMRQVAFFSRLAREVGAALGYAYPDDLERRALGYYQRVYNLPPDAEVLE